MLPQRVPRLHRIINANSTAHDVAPESREYVRDPRDIPISVDGGGIVGQRGGEISGRAGRDLSAESFTDLKRSAAAGVDGVTRREYEKEIRLPRYPDAHSNSRRRTVGCAIAIITKSASDPILATV
jgi:hypothetical protein